MNPVTASISLGWRIERRVRGAAIGAASGVILAGVEAVLASRLAAEAVDRAIASPLVDRVVDRLLSGPELERAVEAAATSPAMERAVARLVSSRIVEEAMARLLESEEFWVIVDEVAHSPAVTDAIAQQSVGFADQVAGGVRDRSRRIDDLLERVARRALRRSPRPSAVAVQPAGEPGAT